MVEKKSGQGKPCQSFFNYMSLLLRKRWTMQVQVLWNFIAKNRCYTNTFKKTDNNNPKQSGSETKPL